MYTNIMSCHWDEISMCEDNMWLNNFIYSKLATKLAIYTNIMTCHWDEISMCEDNVI